MRERFSCKFTSPTSSKARLSPCTKLSWFAQMEETTSFSGHQGTLWHPSDGGHHSVGWQLKVSLCPSNIKCLWGQDPCWLISAPPPAAGASRQQASGTVVEVCLSAAPAVGGSEMLCFRDVISVTECCAAWKVPLGNCMAHPGQHTVSQRGLLEWVVELVCPPQRSGKVSVPSLQMTEAMCHFAVGIFWLNDFTQEIS